MPSPDNKPETNCALEKKSPLNNSVFMRAVRRQPTSFTPVWLMRQAGRYQPKFREIRSRVGFLELCKNSELAAELTVDAVSDLGVDAAIIFADILLPLDALGRDLNFVKGEGPVIGKPVRSITDIDNLDMVPATEALGYVMEAIKICRRNLPSDIPLIGFAGAPFTLASYLIEGASSRNYENSKTLMYRQPEHWAKLMNRLVDFSIEYLRAQVEAGAQCLQVFDSWVGCLSPDDYRQYVLPHSRKLFQALKDTAPTIHFGTGTATLLELMAEAGGDVMGLDWRIGIDQGWERVGSDRAVQGNLDPLVLLADRPFIRQKVESILGRVGARSGHIFNLGHGILPMTDLNHAKYLVEVVHELSRKK